MSPLLSVVVPFYNVESYLRECLESLERQSLRELEVIMVDDGSTDGGAAIAKEFAERDPRFRLVQQPNAGLGPARNAGVPHATGKYLAFADSDDVVPPDAYELMVSSLEKTGSDIACGGVRRIGVQGVTPSSLHEGIFRVARRRTHVREFPELLNDRTAWNKVFRRSFWDRHGFRFPPGLYEDAPVTVPAHVLAGSVDVLREPVYHWRIRESGERSITQRRTEPGNLAARIRSVRAASDFLAANCPELKDVYDRYALLSDIRIYLDAADRGDDAYRETLLDLVNDHLDRIDPGLPAKLPAIERLKFHAVRQRMAPELVRIVSFAKRDPNRTGVVRRPGSDAWYGDYPFLGDPRFPDHLYELSPEHELAPVTGIHEITWRDGRLRIEGHAYVDRLETARPEDSVIEVEVRRRIRRFIPRVLRPRVERLRRPEITAASGQATACQDWSAFAVELDGARLGRSAGTWHVFVTVTAGGVRHRTRLTGPTGAALRPPAHETDSGLRISPGYTRADELVIDVRPVRALVTEARTDGGVIELTGWVHRRDAGLAQDGRLALAPRRSRATVEQPVTVTGRRRGRVTFTARIDPAALAGRDTGSGPRDGAGGVDRDVYLAARGERLRLAARADLCDARTVVGGREYRLIGTRHGNLTLSERPPRPVATAAEWIDARTLRLTGSCADPGTRPDRLALRHSRTGDVHEVPVTWDGAEFTALVTTERPTPQGVLPLPSGRWELWAPGPAGEVPVAVDRTARDALPGPRVAGVHELTVGPHRGELLSVRIRTALTDEERGRYAQRRLRLRYYSAANTAPIRDVVLFESFSGREYSCNPKAIHEELVRRGVDLEPVWSTADGQFRVPGGRTVLRGSTEYHETVASARVIVTNGLQPQGFVKRDGQYYLQTWHGTPYRHIAFDLARSGRTAPGSPGPHRYLEDVPMWDGLLSPGPYVTEMLRRAFRYDGEVIESGWPRNDLLHAADRHARALQVRRRLGIAADRRVVLYAPAGRDDAHPPRERRAHPVLDAERLAEALGEEFAVLVRTAGTGSRVIDVTGYPETGELLLIADALITDYSSVMFDFAGTGRPILFFTPDLESRTGELRGAYLDLATEAPGPLLRTTDEVIDALRDLDGTAPAHAAALRAFRDRYCPLDDGRAAARVVDLLLS
ncbi:bifunctional glycosyltransferase/CDP-glycerol:glycerophosphate glycerophosphotransferase [Thermomonospora amylolytica]|uniref:bifunctional glycosyltransferase/CDP-glycerol:glycerophosphate glycerophosphotransferase n=1 Tax=Thermomonospora amylolytica TaxID=1411117 RepID=UPI000E6C8227|nr:CDP-glycerol glycerophosphotransferase family protein [Thermomonospora amylolytica]